MKLALCMGFIWPVKPCSLSLDSFNEAKIMTASRRVIKFTIGKADLSELESIARSRTEPVGRVERARVLLAYRQDHLSMRWGKPWACIIRRSNATSSEQRPRV